MRGKLNRYDLESKSYGIGYTDDGTSFFFDKSDYEKICNKKWHLINNKSKNYCYLRSVCEEFPQGVQMHRLIMNIVDNQDYDVDHINHDTLDNRKSNLRVISHGENLMNMKIRKNNKTGFTGVYRNKRSNDKQWYAQITVNQKTISGHYCKTMEEAIEERRRLEEQYFGLYSLSSSTTNGPPREEHINIDSIQNHIKGVCSSYGNKWRAYIQVNKIPYQLGVFDTYEEAVIARKQAEEKYLSKDKTNVS